MIKTSKSRRTAAVMFLIAAVMFLITWLLGDTGANTTFIVLGSAVLVLAFNAWPSTKNPDDS